jgi:hypothetical protein
MIFKGKYRILIYIVISSTKYMCEMVTTRSATKQLKVDDFTDPAPTKARRSKKSSSSESKSKEQGESSSKQSDPKQYARKRKSPPTTSKSSSTSKGKRAKTSEENENAGAKEGVVIINRAPVLHLWGACVAQFLHPELAWSTCLSIGQAISTICAISKGRSIGAIEKPEDTEERKRKKEEQRKKAEGLEEVEVMQFHLRMKGDWDETQVVLSGKNVSGSEEGLKRKVGDGYEAVRDAMTGALESWKGEEDELSKEAFGMYEDFRPSVVKGKGGWGRKGELSVERIESVVRKE